MGTHQLIGRGWKRGIFRTLLGGLIGCFGLLPIGLAAQSVPQGFVDATVVSGFSQPVGIAFDANDRLYVWEKGGKVWIVENGVRHSTPLIDISEEVGNWRDHGLLGFALDPGFQNNGRFYLFYTVDRHYLMHHGTPEYDPTANDHYSATIMRLTSYTAVGPEYNVTEPGSRQVLIGETKETGIPLLYESHSTGSLVFGADGTLLLTAGDGANYNGADVGSDPQTYYLQALADGILKPKENVGSLRSQLVDCMNGKLLRIDPMTGDGVPSNPFYDPAAPNSAKSRVWALGLRNAYRFTHRPGTGSSNPADGDPGVFYLGDVGWYTYEETNVCHSAGQNFGWPLFEGMDPMNLYQNARTQDPDAPNTHYGQEGCTKLNFDFQDLLVQESLTMPTGLPNPCDPATLIPANIPVFIHSRPMIDWLHGYQSRCSAFDGHTPVSYDLDDPASPVPGPRFGGAAAAGSTFLSGDGWPEGYQDNYFLADYGGAWMRRIVMDPQDRAVEVHDFATNMGAIAALREGPDGALWYVRYETGQIRKVAPATVANRPPRAVAEQDLLYGPAPLDVQFTGSNSSDPEQGPLSYLWDFGDGQTSTDADPQHTFNAPDGQPQVFTIVLTVWDGQNLSDTDTLRVNVNNTPPSVAITSFPDGLLYPVGVDTTLALEAEVSDAESSTSELTYAWQTIQYKGPRGYPTPTDPAPSSTTVIAGVGCYGTPFHYEVSLTVTDPGGLSTTVVHRLEPACERVAPTAVISATATEGLAPFTATLDGFKSVDNGTIVDYSWELGDGTFASGPEVTKDFTEVGDYHVRLIVTDDDGLSSTATAVIRVFNMDPPQCVGPVGSVLREYFTGIPGSTVNDLINHWSYPDYPSGTTHPTSIKGPVNFANNYGTRIRGYIIPPATGTYTFNTTADDAAVFYLSENAEPSLKRAVSSVPAWTGMDQYDKYPSQQSDPIQLVAGNYYYFELLHKEASAGDHVTVRWTRPGVPALQEVDGSFLAPWEDCPPNVSVRALLDGPFEPATGLLNDDLRAKGFIPHEEPYTALGFTQAGGGGGETIDAAAFGVTGKNAIVDWVLLELRSAGDPAHIMATKAALIRSDGTVADVNGHTRLMFYVPQGEYYLAIRHRNHFGVMTDQPVNLRPKGGAVDFTAPDFKTYGTDARRGVAPGKRALWAGNTVPDAFLKYIGLANDRDAILQQLDEFTPTMIVSGYYQEDVNMDGVVKYTGRYNDREPILINLGGASAVEVRLEQLP